MSETDIAGLVERLRKWCVAPLGNEAASLLEHLAGENARLREGWKEAAIAWTVCASIHREYAKKRDPFFTTRQGDFTKHADEARAALVT